MTIKEWLICLFPLTYCQWKYLTEYFIVVLFMPYINLAINRMSVQQHKVVLVMIIGFAAWATFSFSDPMNLGGGYTAFWIVLLYIADALIQKTGLDRKISQRFALVGYCVCTLLAFTSKIAEVLLGGRLTRLTQGSGFLMDYVSPAILLCAVFLLIAFSQIRQIPKKVIPSIHWLSSVSFGVFLIHSQIIVRTRVYRVAFSWIADLSIIGFVVAVMTSSIAIYFFCGILENLRQQLFVKMRINQYSFTLYKTIKTKILEWINKAM